MKRTIVAIGLLILPTCILAQSSQTENLIYNNTEVTLNASSTSDQLAFAHMERKMLYGTFTSSTTSNTKGNTLDTYQKKRKRVPVLLGVLGGAILYYAGNAVLFGGTENATLPGLTLSALGGGLFALIINNSSNNAKTNKARAPKDKK